MLKRWAESRILSAMELFDVTIVLGPRQAGKTTLCQRIATKKKLPYLTLDDPEVLAYIKADPKGFFQSYPEAVVDEIQRVPQAILALKYAVDQDRRPGRYIVTGSVNLWDSGITPDSLAGRAQVILLLPFSRGEIAGVSPSSFITQAFTGQIDLTDSYTSIDLEDLALWMVKGGYPSTLGYTEAQTRVWMRQHLELVAHHDLPFLQGLRKSDRFMEFIEYLAHHPAQLMNMSTCASALHLTPHTIGRWLDVLEHMFIVKRVMPWHKSGKKRLSKTPKYHFIETAILAALQDRDACSLLSDRSCFGHFLETYIFSELSKMRAVMSEYVSLYHYREHNNHEVDFVLTMAGKVLGIEVKASMSVFPQDFSGLKKLRDACGTNFICGIVIYRGDTLQIREDNLYALPLSRIFNL